MGGSTDAGWTWVPKGIELGLEQKAAEVYRGITEETKQGSHCSWQCGSHFSSLHQHLPCRVGVWRVLLLVPASILQPGLHGKAGTGTGRRI